MFLGGILKNSLAIASLFWWRLCEPSRVFLKTVLRDGDFKIFILIFLNFKLDRVWNGLFRPAE